MERINMLTMENIKEFLRGLEMDNRTLAALVTASACGMGALVLLVGRVHGRLVAENKIKRAKNRRAENLQQAEEAVLRYKQTHPMNACSHILSLSLPELREQLKEGLLIPEDVFYTYMEKTLKVNEKLNCCTGILLDSFDEVRTIESNKEGLLYGIPVSIKENLAYKNTDSTCGVSVNLEKPVKMDSVIVEVLRRQGAIPFVKTNVPQALLNYDCSNPIYGQTLNPCNLNKTPGGSSGGEGALVGGGGSPLGIGTDIGGSVRIPASFCGICGLKPTAGRISGRGVSPIYRGQKSVLSTPGPLANDVESLALCMQALLSDHMFSLDPTIPPIPFNMEIYKSSKPLRIGYLENDGYTQPSPSMVRAMREVRALLERAGHTLVPYNHLRMSETMNELIVRSVLADGAETVLKRVGNDPVDPNLMMQIYPYYLPNWLKRTLSFLLRPVFPRLSASMSAIAGVRSVADLWVQHTASEDYIQETIAEWRRCNIDVLLCPMLGPAYNFHYCGKLISAVTYTVLFNLLNFPAGVVTVSKVTADDEDELKNYKGMYQDQWDRFFKEAVTGAEGLPVSVQCVTLPWQEELCLRFMKEVEQLVKQSRK